MWYKLKRIMMRPNGVEKQVRPIWWQPWANTVAYRPLTSATTVNDQSWNSNNLTNSNVVFGTAHWIDCATISWNSDTIHSASIYLYWNISWLPTWANSRTFSRWMYQDGAASSHDACYIFQWQASTNNMVLIAQWVDGSWDILISQYWTGAVFGSPTIWAWCNHVVVYDWSKFVYYINSVSVGTWTYTINTWSTKFSLWWASENPAWNSFNWAFSNVILEDKARTAQEVSDYYNLTKANYGL